MTPRKPTPKKPTARKATAHSNTVSKQRENLKPFTKGDPRINRKGRPRVADQLKEALMAKWDMPAVFSDGKTRKSAETGKVLTYGDNVISRLFGDPKLYPELLNRAFGKVKDEVEITSPVITIKRVMPEDIEAADVPLEKVTEPCAD